MMKLLNSIAVCLTLILSGTEPAAAYKAVTPSNFSTVTGATAGDSIAAYGVSQLPNGGYSLVGPAQVAREMMGGSLYIPLSNGFAVGGTYCNLNTQIPAYYRAAVASQANYIFGDACRNDLAGGVTGVSLLSSITSSISLVSRSNSHLLFIPLLPETAYTTIQNQYKAYVNRHWSEAFSGMRPDLDAQDNLDPNNLPVFLDEMFMENNVDGTRLAGFGTADGTHLVWSGSAKFATQEVPILKGGIPPRPTYMEWFHDWYDATNNPTGNLLNGGAAVNDGLFAGSGGLLTTYASLTPTGTIATHWTALRGSGTSTATMALSKESPRADGLTGTGQVVQIDCSSGGSNYEQYRIQYNQSMTTIVGKTVFAKGTVEVLDTPTGYLGTQVSLQESGAATPNTVSDGSPLQDTNNVGPANVLTNIYLRTPPFVVQTGSTNMYDYFYIYMDCRAAGHVKLAIRDAGVRYYQ